MDLRLVKCMSAGDVDNVKACLEDGADPNSRLVEDEKGRECMPLHRACMMSQLDIATLLVEAGADVNALCLNGVGVSALSIAATNGDADMVAMLLANGADPNIAAKHGGDDDPLVNAAMSGSDRVMRALLAAGANPNGTSAERGVTALMMAANTDKPSKRDTMCAMLLEAGADPLAVSVWGDTALVFAPDCLVLRRATERARRVSGAWLDGSVPPSLLHVCAYVK